MPNTNVRAAATGLPKTYLDPSIFPDIYGLTIAGNCMAPALPDGGIVKVSKSAPYSHGDVVVVWMRPEFVKPGHQQAMLKRVVLMPPPWAKTFPYRDHPESEALALLCLGQDDRPDEMLQIRCSEILAVHKCLGLIGDDDRPVDARRPNRKLAR